MNNCVYKGFIINVGHKKTHDYHLNFLEIYSKSFIIVT
jgi:hypothetical protein